LARAAYFFALAAAFLALADAALTALTNFLATAAFLAESLAVLAESFAFLEATEAALAAFLADFEREVYFFFAAATYAGDADFDFKSLSYADLAFLAFLEAFFDEAEAFLA